MIWPLTSRRRRKGGALPPDLVAAIENIGCVFRSFRENEHGDRVPRPLTFNFLGTRPVYLDDDEAVARLLRQHYPDLDERQVARAISLIGRRVANMRHDSQDREDLLKSGRRRRRGWVGDFVERREPWEL